MRPALALLLSLATLPASGHAATTLESRLLEDVADRKLKRLDLLDASLLVSGATEKSELAASRARIRASLDPIVKSIDRRDPAAAARSLLRALHTSVPGSPALLKAYEAHATTLLDIAEHGRFNCVSATLLFLIGAKELGLDARAVLLPSHARAVVLVGGRHAAVETTSPNGYDASAETSREVLKRFRPNADPSAVELYGDERGTEVDDIALLGVVYTNLAVGLKQKGDLAAAEALDSRADLFVSDSARPLLRQVRVSTLGELAIGRLNEGRTADAVDLALQAAQLVPAGDESGRVAHHNLKAMAQRRMDELSPSDEPSLLAFADRFKGFAEIERDLRSRAWSLIGADRSRRGDFEGAAKAAREAARLGGPAHGALSHNLAVAELNRVMELAKVNPDKAWPEWQKLSVPDELATPRKQVGGNIALARAQKAFEAHDCRELDQRVAEWRALTPDAPGGQLRASCRNDEGLAHWKAEDFAAAAASFREAMKLNPDEKAFERNLIGALGNQANKLLAAHQCREARPIIAEGRRVAPGDEGFKKAQEFCDRK